MTLEIPKGFTFVYGDKRYNAPRRIINYETGDNFLLSNRSWKEVNRAFAGAPGSLVRRLLKQADAKNPILVLDIGAGEQTVIDSDFRLLTSTMS